MSRVDVEGVRVHQQVEGPEDGFPLVLVNSLGTDLGMWDGQAPALAERFRLVRYDLRGHGRSDAPPGPYTIEAFGADLAGLMDGLGIGRAHVCGLSLGGMVAMWLSIHRPERVERTVLAGTAARIGTAALWEERAEAVRAGGMEAVAGTVIDRFFTAPFRDRRPDVVKGFREALTSTRPAGYVGSCLALRDADLRAEVGAIAAPVLVVVGAGDVATPPSDAESLHEGIPGSRLVVLRDAGHLCNVEQPELFNAAVLEFLAG